MKTKIGMISILLMMFMLAFQAGAQEKDKEDDVFYVVDELPVFPGGEEALRNWLAENIRYPEEAKSDSIQGKVYVTFVINEQGKVTETKLARGASPALDKEALRVVKEMPAWQPGKHKGKEVKVSYTVPIDFKLE